MTHGSSRRPRVRIAALAAAALALPSSAAVALPVQDGGPPPDVPAAVAGTVTSKDGTKIAYERSGKGPLVVLVAPALADRGGSRRLAALLASDFTVVNYDRRGRGASGDAPEYAVAREVEDVEALIDAVGGPAYLFGCSSGAVLALEAANALPEKVSKLAMVEPPFVVDDSRPPVPDDFVAHVKALVAEGRRGDAVAYFMTDAVGVPAEMLPQIQASPMWPEMERMAHTLAYDGAVVAGTQGGKPLPKTRWTTIAATCFVLDGGESPEFLRNAAVAAAGVLPRATHRTLPGQDHSIVFSAPHVLAPVLVEFFRAEPARAPEDGGKRP